MRSCFRPSEDCARVPQPDEGRWHSDSRENGLYGKEDADFFFRARRMGYQIGYIERMGNHFGTGDLDTGEYRKFKDGCRTNNVANFQKKCHEYVSGKRSIYLPFS